jgi:diketogulonate reductase-like aldo/keto reductase
MTQIPTYVLNDGASLPAIGFGTYPLRGEDGTAAMVSALEAGYRMLDTAVNYQIGVSNFTEEHLTRIIDDTGVVPAVNQVELHPRFPQPRMREVHERLGIRTQAWSPMGKRRAPLEESAVTAAAEAHGVTPGRVILRWHVQLGSLPIPKSADPQRQAQNLDVFGFELTPTEVAAISGLAEDDGRLFGGDPDIHEEM